MRINIEMLINVVLVGMAGCSVIPEQEMPDLSRGDNSTILEWSDVQIGDCPIIEGEFTHAYESLGWQESEEIEPVEKFPLLRNLTGRFQVNGIQIDTEKNPSEIKEFEKLGRETFIVLDQTEDKFAFVSFAAPDYPDGQLVVRKTYDRRLGHFTCEDGFIVLPKTVVYGGYEWGTANRQSSARIGTTVDGSLVLYEQTGPWKKTFVKGAGDIKHMFYKFELNTK